MDQNVTVRVQAKTDAGMANPFKQMAADGKKLEASFDGITKSVKLSQQAMAKFADSIKFASEQSKKFAQWSGGAGGNAAGGGNGFGQPAGMGNMMGGLNAQALFETFNKIASSGKSVVALFDQMSGSNSGDRMALRQTGPLGSMAADLSDLIEDLTTRADQAVGFKSDSDWSRRSNERKMGRSEAQLMGAGELGWQFQVAGRQGRTDVEDRIFAASQNAGDSTAAQLAAADAMSARFKGQAADRLKGAASAWAGYGPNGSEGLARGQEVVELKFAEDAQRKLIESEQKKLDLIRQQGKERQDQLKAQLEAGKAEESRLRSIIEQEKSRLGGFAGEFGRLDPLQQQQARVLAAKVGGGGELSRDEREAARGFGFFGDVVARGDQKAGEAAGFGGIAKQLGLDLKLREAEIAVKAVVEARVDIESRIVAELKVNDSAVVEQLSKALLPELAKMQDIREQRLRAEFEKQLYAAKVARNQ